jgi:hypothetical protein
MAEPQVITCGAQCEVTVMIEPAPASEERLADIGEMFVLFLVAAVIVFCARGLVNLFWKNHED